MRAPVHTHFLIDANAAEATASVQKVLEGDVSLLVARVNAGALLSFEERELIVKSLRQEPLRSNSRPPKAETAWLKETVALWIYVQKHLTGHKQEALVADAMAKFGKSRAYVMAALKEKRRDPLREKMFDGMAAMAAEMARNGGPEQLPIVTVRVPPPPGMFPPDD